MHQLLLQTTCISSMRDSYGFRFVLIASSLSLWILVCPHSPPVQSKLSSWLLALMTYQFQAISGCRGYSLPQNSSAAFLCDPWLVSFDPPAISFQTFSPPAFPTIVLYLIPVMNPVSLVVLLPWPAPNWYWNLWSLILLTKSMCYWLWAGGWQKLKGSQGKVWKTVRELLLKVAALSWIVSPQNSHV